MAFFDDDTFMDQEIAETIDDVTTPLATDVPYPGAVIDEVKKRTTPRAGAHLLEITWVVPIPEGQQKDWGRDTGKFKQTVWLDVSEEGVLLSGPNQNLDLGRLRTAVGQNVPGQPWTPRMLVGSAATVYLKERPVKDDEGNVVERYMEVRRAIAS